MPPAPRTAPSPSGPRYFQIKVALENRIAQLPAGTSLPPERKLAAELKTSRTTLRRALAELTAEGVLSSTQGSGNFVAPPKMVHVRQLTSFSDDMTALGGTLESEMLSAATESASDDVAEHLGIDPGAPLHRLTRLRVVNGEPIALETAHVSGELGGLADAVTRRGSLYATLADEFGVHIHEVEDSVQTALATPEQAQHLRVTTGTPLLLIERTSRDAAGTIIEWTRSFYRGDRVRFMARGQL